jgi:hypothetical protein
MVLCMVNDTPPYWLGKWCLFINVIKENVKSLQPSKKETKLNEANDNHVAGYHTLSDQAHDKLSKQSGAKSTKCPT